MITLHEESKQARRRHGARQKASSQNLPLQKA